jgi:hypothetical protein
MSSAPSSPVDPSDHQLTRLQPQVQPTSRPLDPSPDQLHRFESARSSEPMPPADERVHQLANQLSEQRSIPLEPTPEQRRRLELDTAPKKPHSEEHQAHASQDET